MKNARAFRVMIVLLWIVTVLGIEFGSWKSAALGTAAILATIAVLLTGEDK